MKARLLIFLSFLLLAACPASASTIIYYYNPADHDLTNVSMIYNLLGHFDGDLRTVNVVDYQAGQMNGFEFVVFYAPEWDTLPDAFLTDIAGNQHRLLWIGGGLDQLFDYLGGPGPFGFTCGPDVQPGGDWDQIKYKGRTIPREANQNFFVVHPDEAAHVYSYLASTKLHQQLPHFVCGGNLCFITDDPLVDSTSDDRYLVFADLLHEFYQTGAPEQKLAMIRLEDIAPVVTNSKLLVEYADQLHDQGIPFSFGVVPIFKDPEGKYFPAGSEFHFSDDPDLVKAIEHLRKLGGVMIMHGVTHQHGNGISREDWEFSLGLDNQPVPEDSAAWARERLDRGLAEFAGEGWRPRIWETPHYSASWGDYLTFAEYFDFCYERLLVFPVGPEAPPSFGEDLHPYSQMIPYFLQTSADRMAVLPETLNYIDLSSPDPYWHPEGKLAYTDRLSIIRDGVASVFVHFEFVPFEYLQVLLDGLKDRGYTFVGPEHFVGPLDDSTDDDATDDDSHHDRGHSGGCGG